MRASLVGLFLFFSLYGCGATEPASRTAASSEPPPAPTEEVAPADSPEPEQAAEPAPEPTEPTAPTACASALDCTLVTDGCGRPHAALIGAEPEFVQGRICPPQERRPVEPTCTAGRCELLDVSRPERRECNADADCVVLDGVCATWTVAHRDHRDAVAREVAEQESIIDCAQTERPPSPSAACLVGVCVARRAR